MRPNVCRRGLTELPLGTDPPSLPLCLPSLPRSAAPGCRNDEVSCCAALHCPLCIPCILLLPCALPATSAPASTDAALLLPHRSGARASPCLPLPATFTPNHRHRSFQYRGDGRKEEPAAYKPGTQDEPVKPAGLPPAV